MTKIQRVMVREFARRLGFADEREMFDSSEILYREGPDIRWWLTRMYDGRYVVWDEAEIAFDRVGWFDTEEAARKWAAECWKEKGEKENEKDSKNND